MTNERKFLNSNVSAYEFSMAFNLWCFNNKGLGTSQADKMQLFLNAPAKPTLTEDERVILRNIGKDYSRIYRNGEGKIFVYSKRKKAPTYATVGIFSHLFQFIKNGEGYNIKELLGDEK